MFEIIIFSDYLSGVPVTWRGVVECTYTIKENAISGRGTNWDSSCDVQ